MTQRPDSAPGTAPAFSRKATRLPSGDGLGQFPARGRSAWAGLAGVDREQVGLVPLVPGRGVEEDPPAVPRPPGRAAVGEARGRLVGDQRRRPSLDVQEVEAVPLLPFEGSAGWALSWLDEPARL